MSASNGFSPQLLSRIEDVCLNASVPPQQLWVDGWMVRYCPGKAKRARSVNAVADGVQRLEDRLEAAAAIYRRAGLPLIFRITPFTQPAGLDEWLAQRGFVRADDSRVMVATELHDHTELLPQGLEFCALDHAQFAEQVGALRDSPLEHRQAHAQRLGQSPVPYQGWVFRQARSGLVVACGQVAIEAECVGIYDVFTYPEHRGQGLARLLCAELLKRARAAGARLAYLQVDASNAPAMAVYRRLGFADAYGYHYRMLESDAGSA